MARQKRKSLSLRIGKPHSPPGRFNPDVGKLETFPNCVRQRTGNKCLQREGSVSPKPGSWGLVLPPSRVGH